MKVVLLGSIPKGDKVRSDWADWKPAYMHAIQKTLPNVEFVHGDSISDNAGAKMVVGHDLTQVKRADVCVVGARVKIGAGTAQEMVIAKYLRKPVVSIIPKDSHHRKTNIAFHDVTLEDWIHPFLAISSDYVAESIDSAAQWIAAYAKSPTTYSIKGMSVFTDAIKHFEQSS